jgi:hypothetical protein
VDELFAHFLGARITDEHIALRNKSVSNGIFLGDNGIDHCSVIDVDVDALALVLVQWASAAAAGIAISEFIVIAFVHWRVVNFRFEVCHWFVWFVVRSLSVATRRELQMP